MSGTRPGLNSGTEIFSSPRGRYETLDPAACRFGAHPDFLCRAHLWSPGLLLPRPGTGGGVHGDAGLPVRDHGGQTHALAVLPRVQPAFQRDPAAARRAAVATGRPRETRPGRGPAASRFPLSRLPGILDPLRGVFLLCARGVFRGGGDLPRPRVHLRAEYLSVFSRVLSPLARAGARGWGRIARYPRSPQCPFPPKNNIRKPRTRTSSARSSRPISWRASTPGASGTASPAPRSRSTTRRPMRRRSARAFRRSPTAICTTATPSRFASTSASRATTAAHATCASTTPIRRKRKRNTSIPSATG